MRRELAPGNRWGGDPCGDLRPTLFSGLGALLDLVEGTLEDVVRLGAEQEQPAIEDEGGDGVDARLVRLGRRGVDTTGVAPVGERGGGFLAVEPGFGHEVEQRSRSPMFLASVQYACMSRACTSSWRPFSRASSVNSSACREFGTTSGGGL